MKGIRTLITNLMVIYLIINSKNAQNLNCYFYQMKTCRKDLSTFPDLKYSIRVLGKCISSSSFSFNNSTESNERHCWKPTENFFKNFKQYFSFLRSNHLWGSQFQETERRIRATFAFILSIFLLYIFTVFLPEHHISNSFFQ